MKKYCRGWEAAGAYCADYDIVVVKQGYIFPELKEMGALSIMSLTDGATYQFWLEQLAAL